MVQCPSCRKVFQPDPSLPDGGEWVEVEAPEAGLPHRYCPVCEAKLAAEMSALEEEAAPLVDPAQPEPSEPPASPNLRWVTYAAIAAAIVAVAGAYSWYAGRSAAVNQVMADAAEPAGSVSPASQTPMRGWLINDLPDRERGATRAPRTVPTGATPEESPTDEAPSTPSAGTPAESGSKKPEGTKPGDRKGTERPQTAGLGGSGFSGGPMPSRGPSPQPPDLSGFDDELPAEDDAAEQGPGVSLGVAVPDDPTLPAVPEVGIELPGEPAPDVAP